MFKRQESKTIYVFSTEEEEEEEKTKRYLLDVIRTNHLGQFIHTTIDRSPVGLQLYVNLPRQEV